MATGPKARSRRVREGSPVLERDERDEDGDRARRSGRARSRRAGEDVGLVEGVIHNVTDDANALLQAWSEANAEVIKGITSVLGTLLLDVRGSTGRRRERSRGRDESRRDRGRAELDRDRDDRDRDDRDELDDYEDYADNVTMVSRSVSDAVADTAATFERASDRFRRRYRRVARHEEDDELHEDDEFDRDRRPRGERGAAAAEGREREYRKATDKRDEEVRPPEKGQP